MRLAFLGTPDFAVRALAELAASGHEIAAVYTQPPKPRGRGQTLQPSPVQAFAEGLGLEVRTPASMKTPEAIAGFQALELDAAIVVAYGQILVREVLEAPRYGCFNLHGSLLPRWRGAAPIQRAIMAGDPVTGVQVMRMSEGLDEGPVLLSATVPITAEDTVATLHDKLAIAGAGLLPVALGAIARGGATETPQAAEGVTYAKKIKPAEARIDWSRPARELDWHIRGLSPFPGAWFEAPGGIRVKALLSQVADGAGQETPRTPGEVLDGSPEGGLVVACGEGAVRIARLQREGKGQQPADAFLRGLPLAAGTVLG
jgi:methionyl-tRNA formyltransferase